MFCSGLHGPHSAQRRSGCAGHAEGDWTARHGEDRTECPARGGQHGRRVADTAHRHHQRRRWRGRYFWHYIFLLIIIKRRYFESKYLTIGCC